MLDAKVGRVRCGRRWIEKSGNRDNLMPKFLALSILLKIQYFLIWVFHWHKIQHFMGRCKAPGFPAPATGMRIDRDQVATAGVHVPQPPALSQAGVVDLLSLAGVLSSLATFFWLPFLKSVSYQPLPLNRNPTGEISFFSSGWPQLGQSLSSGSLSFCKASSS